MAFGKQPLPLSTEQIEALDRIQKQYQAMADHIHYEKNQYTFESDKVHYHVGDSYVRMDIGSSGAFMIDIAAGIIYGIQGYGRPDKKKNVGNAWQGFDGAHMPFNRFRRGRFTNNPDGSR